MCGIAGSFALPSFDVPAAVERLRHRGPDAAAVAEADGCVHGHARLSLVDLSSASDQPFRTAAGSVLSFNGEIWNWRAIRAELECRGRSFATSGDTEVLAQALEQWGVAALCRLEGMWAFAWSSGRHHILARDRFGEIPLYVHRSGSGFAWSSERKGLGRGRPCSALPPGHWLDLASGALGRWYEPDAPRPHEAVADALARGVAHRLDADAPLCCLVSGGLDSSLVLALARRARPDVVGYTAVLDPASADLRAAREICAELSVPLVEVPIPAPSAADLEGAALAIEIDSKAQVEIAALCVPLARAIASDGFKACLSGEAADELFGGYGSMCIKGSSADDDGWRAIRAAALAKMARGNFVRCNKAFMAAGVECRLPFMDVGLVEAVSRMSKAECPPGKGLLKAAAEGLIPRRLARRQKDTFQGGAGMDAAAAALFPDPARFYRSVVRTAYGPSARD